MDDLVRRLREATEQMKKGVYGPGQVAVIREAADAIEARDRGVMVRIETEDDRAVSEEKTMRILPILFNTPMVQAILDGRKTQTRRICKDGSAYSVPDMSFFDPERRTYAVRNYQDRENEDQISLVEAPVPICPGDILYVRETWGFGCTYSDEGKIYYRATDEIAQVYTWHPSIHMPKEAARIFLRVTDVGVERLQDMRLAECLAEGVRLTSAEEDDLVRAPIAARNRFGGVWDSTIKPADRDRYGWDANPWVWVYTFERCKKPEGF